MLPILPQVNDGQHQALLLIRPEATDEHQLVALRVWPSNRELQENNTPVWVGNVVYLYREREIPLITYLRTAPSFDTPMEQLHASLMQSDHIGTTLRIRLLPQNQLQANVAVLLAWETSP
jgi:hypothetical protein